MPHKMWTAFYAKMPAYPNQTHLKNAVPPNVHAGHRATGQTVNNHGVKAKTLPFNIEACSVCSRMARKMRKHAIWMNDLLSNKNATTNGVRRYGVRINGRMWVFIDFYDFYCLAKLVLYSESFILPKINDANKRQNINPPKCDIIRGRWPVSLSHSLIVPV